MTAPAAQSSAAVPLATVYAARQMQLAVRAQLMGDVARLWPLLRPKDVQGSFPGWLAAMAQLVARYHSMSSVAAGRGYLRARESATRSPAPFSLVALAAAPSPDWLRAAFGFSGPGLLTRDTAQPGTALSTTLGTASRIALAGGRQTLLNTVAKDPVALGWYRVTDGDPCAFCALLASRGVVYKAADTVDFKSHNDCGCFGAPAFSREQELPDITRRAQDVYRSRGKGPALVAFRKAWAEHQASRSA